MAKHAPDNRLVVSLQAQLGMLEQMLRPVLGGQPSTDQTRPAANNVVAMRPPATPQNNSVMQQQMLENMLAGVEPQKAAQLRGLMAIAAKPNVNPTEMEVAVAPLMSQLQPQDQATVRMMMSMMQQQHPASQAVLPAGTQPSVLPVPVAQPQPYAIPAEVQHALDQATARAATALEESRRVAAELVTLKDTQNQTAAAMFQQTQVMKELVQMLKVQMPEVAVDDTEEPHPPQDAAS